MCGGCGAGETEGVGLVAGMAWLLGGWHSMSFWDRRASRPGGLTFVRGPVTLTAQGEPVQTPSRASVAPQSCLIR